MLLIHEVMTRRPITATPDTTIGDLLAQFDRYDVNAIPVVEPAGVLVGIVTKLDLLRVVRAAQAARSQRIETIMRCGVVTVEPDDPVVAAADRMLETRLRSLPVVERRPGSAAILVGMVSQGDLIRGLRKGLAETATAPALQESPWEVS